jgi:poly(A) polymerase
LLDHPRFRAAFDFMLLRAAAGEVEQEIADWWADIQTQSPEVRVEMVESQPAATTKSDAGSGGATAPAKKRRRRRSRSKRPSDV